MTPQEEIEALIARIAMADRKAFRDLYGRTSAKLYGVALRVCGQEATAEEVLQDVYLRVWNNAGRYRSGRYSPMTWLITIARNAAIDRLRRARAAREAAPIDDADLLRDPGPGPETAAIRSDDARRLEACLGELPDARAAMVRAVYLDGLRYDDVARISGTKLNTVRTWLRRSLSQLRECLSR